MKLYNYFRSGTSHRLRIALNLKGLDYEYVAINLLKDEQQQESFKKLNPQGLVPALGLGSEVLIQSPAIIEWLEEAYPTPPLLPNTTSDRQKVRALAAIVGSDIHPINNRRILQTLRSEFSADDEAINRWCGKWITDGFDSIETILSDDKNRNGFSFGYAPTLADVYLIPQIESAKRFKVDLTRWPNIMGVEEECLKLESFSKAAPSNQPDF